MRLLKRGDRIRLKEPLMSGWKGTATVTEDQINGVGCVWFRKDGSDPDDWMADRCCALRYQVALIRKTSNAGGKRDE